MGKSSSMHALTVVGICFVAACGDDGAPRRAMVGAGGDAGAAGAGGVGGAAGFGACGPGKLLLDGGGCCAAGELEDEGGGCRPAGIPADQCARGFDPDDRGACSPVLPAQPCAKGTMAVPGETTCHDVAPCGAAPWGDIPVDASTQFVDGSYLLGDSDGTAVKPWPTIQAGIDAAASGAIVAIAAGSYVEDIAVQGKPVRVWGLCPAEVEIIGTGTASAAVLVLDGAAGAELRDLAVTGAALGVLLTGSEDVIVDRVWIHDTTGPGVQLQNQLGPTAATIGGSLIEATTVLGVANAASEVTIESTVVRDTKPNPADQKFGQGINVQALDMVRGTLVLRGSLVERNTGGGVLVFGSDASIEATVVRDSLPKAVDQTGGQGIVAQNYPGLPLRADLVLRSSAIEGNREVGVFVYGSNATIESTVVRDTLPRAADDRFGRGINVQPDPETLQRGSLVLRSSVIDGSHEAGVFAAGSDALIETTVVRDTQPRAADQEYGQGISAQSHPDTGASSLTLRSSVVDRSSAIGVSVWGSDAEIDACVIRETRAQESDLSLGRGVSVQHDPITGLRSTASIRSSVVEANIDIGVCVVDADVSVATTLVRATQPRASDGAFGDGIAVGAKTAASLTVVGSQVEGSARAGVSSFGAAALLESSVLECNAIHLAAELFGALAADFEDAGGNQCGCGGDAAECTVLSSNLAPPEPADPVEQ